MISNIGSMSLDYNERIILLKLFDKFYKEAVDEQGKELGETLQRIFEQIVESECYSQLRTEMLMWVIMAKWAPNTKQLELLEKMFQSEGMFKKKES